MLDIIHRQRPVNPLATTRRNSESLAEVALKCEARTVDEHLNRHIGIGVIVDNRCQRHYITNNSEARCHRTD